jgi:hypothetical protein
MGRRSLALFVAAVTPVRRRALIDLPRGGSFASCKDENLALAVSDQHGSRRFYETYFGFDAEPPRRYDDGVLMLYKRSTKATSPGWGMGASVRHEVGFRLNAGRR